VGPLAACIAYMLQRHQKGTPKFSNLNTQFILRQTMMWSFQEHSENLAVISG